ncbi:unnamed protein product [Urochloa humidicola]
MVTRRFLVAAAALAWLCAIIAGQDADVMPFAPTCSNTSNYTTGSQYQKNLVQLLSRLTAAAIDNGWFYNDTAGMGADQVFGLVMCYADHNETQCRDCLFRAPAWIRAVCPGSRNVSAAYDACLLRYSPAPIPAAADLSYTFAVDLSVPGIPITLGALRDSLLPLMDRLTGDAATSPLRIASGNMTRAGRPLLEMYVLVQCTRDLDAGECRRCINSYVGWLEGHLIDKLNNTGVAIKGYSCYLRYQVDAFDITLPPPPPQQPSRGPGSSSKTGLAIGLSLGAASLIILASLIWFHRLRLWKHAKILEEVRGRKLEEGNFFDDELATDEDEFEKGTGPKRF